MRIVNLTEETRKNILKDLLKMMSETVETRRYLDIQSSLIKQISMPEMFWLQKKRLNMLIHRLMRS